MDPIAARITSAGFEPVNLLLNTATASFCAAAVGSGNFPLAVYVVRSAFVFSLASATFGSSKGLIASTAPATAVANSQRKNSAPRSSILVERRSRGWPAPSSAFNFSSSGASFSVISRRTRDRSHIPPGTRAVRRPPAARRYHAFRSPRSVVRSTSQERPDAARAQPSACRALP